MRKRLILLVLAVAPVLAAAGIAVGSSAFDGAKSATARFHDVDQAREAGYSAMVADKAGLTCIAQPGEGAMGIHMLKPELLFGDGTIDAAKPELLVYERRNNGTMKLVALEYLVFQSEWKGARPAVALRQGVRRDQGGQPLRDPGLLGAPRLDLEAEPERDALRMEPARRLRAGSGQLARGR